MPLRHLARLAYGIAQTDVDVADLSYRRWNEIVQEKVESKVFEELCVKAKEASKTKDLQYKLFTQCQYLSRLDPLSVHGVARFRS